MANVLSRVFQLSPGTLARYYSPHTVCLLLENDNILQKHLQKTEHVVQNAHEKVDFLMHVEGKQHAELVVNSTSMISGKRDPCPETGEVHFPDDAFQG